MAHTRLARRMVHATGTLAAFAFLALVGRVPETPAPDRPLKLTRGLVTVPRADGLYVGWRLLDADDPRAGFDLYRFERGTSVDAAVKVNAEPITSGTNFVDTGADPAREADYHYVVRSLADQGPMNLVGAADAAAPSLRTIALQNIGQGAKHVGVGDLNGDGVYDFVVKRGNGDKDPSQSGDPNETYKLEAYNGANGAFMWRYDMGPNIRAGVWTSPFVVFDLNNDGRAEVATKRGDTVDRTDADGRDLTGPEYVAILNGQTGALVTTQPWPERGTVDSWGDNYGNRCDRHLMTVAYFGGGWKLMVMRGTYTKMYVDAYTFNGSSLSRNWRWYRSAGGGGFHNVRVGDIDNDGQDELINGSIAINDNGTQMWITDEGHGDRLHMTDIDPNRSGKEIFYIEEGPSDYEHPVHLRQASNGGLIWGKGDDSWGDVGRGNCADIDPVSGLECWASVGNLYSATGTDLGTKPGYTNFSIWWDGDAYRELMDGDHIDKWNPSTKTLTTLATFSGVTLGSRSAPMGYADITGDWREEVFHVAGNELRIYSTNEPTSISRTSWMNDRDYRSSVASETMGYMQSTQPSVYFGGASSTPTPTATPTTRPTARPTATPRATATPRTRPTPTNPPASAVYSFANVNSGKCLDLWEWSTADNARISQFACGGGNNQKWTAEDMGGGYFRFRSLHSGKCLDISGSSTGDGAGLVQYTCGTGQNQQFQMVDTGSGQYRLTPRHSAKALDLANCSTADGATVQQWAWLNNNCQKFTRQQY